jgi:hypothetical protein
MCPAGGPPELDSATTTAFWAAEDCVVDTWRLKLVCVVMRKVHRWRDEGRRKGVALCVSVCLGPLGSGSRSNGCRSAAIKLPNRVLTFEAESQKCAYCGSRAAEYCACACTCGDGYPSADAPACVRDIAGAYVGSQFARRTINEGLLCLGEVGEREVGEHDTGTGAVVNGDGRVSERVRGRCALEPEPELAGPWARRCQHMLELTLNARPQPGNGHWNAVGTQYHHD